MNIKNTISTKSNEVWEIIFKNAEAGWISDFQVKLVPVW